MLHQNLLGLPLPSFADFPILAGRFTYTQAIGAFVMSFDSLLIPTRRFCLTLPEKDYEL